MLWAARERRLWWPEHGSRPAGQGERSPEGLGACQLALLHPATCPEAAGAPVAVIAASAACRLPPPSSCRLLPMPGACRRLPPAGTHRRHCQLPAVVAVVAVAVVGGCCYVAGEQRSNVCRLITPALGPGGDAHSRSDGMAPPPAAAAVLATHSHTRSHVVELCATAPGGGAQPAAAASCKHEEWWLGITGDGH